MIWDERWGDPWTTVIYEDPIWGSAKTMSLPNNDAIAGQGDRWFQWHMEFKRNDPDPDVFAYRWAGTSFNYGGANMTKFQPIQPANYQDFYTKVNAWTRHWIIFQEVAPYTDPVSLVTIWTADENRAPVKVLDARQIRIPWDPATARGWKRTEMLIQPKPNRLPDGGTSVFTHYRNFIILKNYPDIPSILVSPLAGDPIGTIAGIATVTGVSASQSAAESVGTSNGVGAATGVGQSTMTVVGASAGASVAVAQPETGLFGFKARHHMLMMDTI